MIITGKGEQVERVSKRCEALLRPCLRLRALLGPKPAEAGEEPYQGCVPGHLQETAGKEKQDQA